MFMCFSAPYKMVRKRSQEGQDIKTASWRRPGSPQEADFPAIVEPKIEQQIFKSNIKIIELFDHLLDPKNDRT